MKVWLLRASEMMPVVDKNDRLLRMGMLGEELSEQGHDVTWLASTFNHYKKIQVSDKDIVIPVKDNYRLNLIYAKGYRKNISIARILNHKMIAVRLKKKIKRMEKPDIIFTSFPTIEFADVAVKYGKKNHIPVVIDVRDLWPDTFYHNLKGIVKILSVPYVTYLNFKTKRIMKNCYCITSITDQMLDWGLKKGKREKTKNDKSFFIGYEKEQNIPLDGKVKLDKKKFNIAFFATINNQFNYELIVKIANKLKNTKAHFLICGLGPQLDYFKKVAGASKNIEFLGWQDKNNIDYVLRNSQIGLAPYKDTFDFRMSVSNKYAEYLSYGLPIVITSSGYMKQITEKYDVGISSSDEKVISDYIIKLMNDSNEYNKISNNSRELFNNKFDANKIYKDLAKYLEKIAKEYRK